MDYATFKQLVKDKRAANSVFEGTRKSTLSIWGDDYQHNMVP